MKIGRFAVDPKQKPGDVRDRTQLFNLAEPTRQFGVGKGRVQGAMANRVHGHSVSTVTTFWDRVMPFDLLAE